MQITVVAVMCHTLGAVVAQSIGTLDQPYCREVVIIRMQACMLSQPALAEANSIYKSDSWRIERIKCVPGDYVPKKRV
jgi:hypothetical protein